MALLFESGIRVGLGVSLQPAASPVHARIDTSSGTCCIVRDRVSLRLFCNTNNAQIGGKSTYMYLPAPARMAVTHRSAALLLPHEYGSIELNHEESLAWTYARPGIDAPLPKKPLAITSSLDM